ncbi:ankyrin-1-like [Homalodisca vitripennis]|uniref:ankyrin-1-like n=1 Tax=Homalodisca vitripennis TaxID=197043 RepID=UPI001EEA0F56|nr:ankyrin-1-like [Homalodisca vitripennis]
MAPRRKGRKGPLQYALEECDRGQLTTIISSKGDFDDKAGMEVMHCIRRQKEVFKNNISALQGAISLGHYNICKHLVEEGAILKSVSRIPHPLCLALQKGHYEIANLLIQAGADVNLAFDDIYPMAFALDESNCPVQIVKEIIAAGFPKNGVVDRTCRRTTLHSAVRLNHYHIVQYLFTLDIDPNVKDKRGLTAMHYAVQKNYPPMVELLAKNGVKLDCECQEHFTPMFYCIAIGNYEMVKLLISLGADIHYVNGSKKCSMMPLHFAANFCQFKIAQLLLEKGADVNRVVPSTGEIALHAAARADSQNKQPSKIALDCIVELLIKYGSKLDTRHKYGLSPLQVAIKAKNISIAKILIMNGSELNNGIEQDDARCYTTFHIAAKCFDKELVKLCFDYGADANAKDEEGLYPCHLALLTAMLDIITHSADCTQSLAYCQNQSEQLAIFKLFWRHNFPFDLTLRMKWLENENPPFPTKISTLIERQKMLFSGLKTQQVRLVQKAISQGAEVRCCSTEIPHPLHYITAKGNEIIMKILLSRGLQPNVLDKHGETALHVAAREGFVNCCQLLLEYGAVYNHRSPKCPKTPLDFAKENGHTEVVTLLSTVEKYFKHLKKKKFRKLETNMKIFCAVMNCCGNDGMSLMGRAVSLGLKDFAERLMKLRLQMAPSS